MDTLEAPGDGGAYAQQQRPLGSPVTGTTGAVFFAGDDQQWYPFLLVVHRCFVNGGLLATGKVERVVSFLLRQQAIAQANIAKSAAYHHLVVTTPRSIGVEVALFDAMLDQILSGRAGSRKVASRGNVIRSDRGCNEFAHFLRGRPQVTQEDRLAVDIGSNRVFRQIDVYSAGQRISDDQGG